MASSLVISQVLLMLNFIFAFYSIWGLFLGNGANDMATAALARAPPLLPGTTQPVKQRYTGIKAIDDQLVFLVVMFWEIIDGSMPDLSLFSFMFAGQALCSYTLILIEGVRNGNRGKLVTYTTVLSFLSQNFTYACFLPLFLILHIHTSPTVSSQSGEVHAIPDSSIEAVLISAFGGFTVPAVLMVLPAPSMISYDFKQNMMSLWQIFPINKALLYAILSFSLPLLRRPEPGTSKKQSSSMANLRLGYVVAFAAAAVTRIATMTIIAVNTLFPTVFAPEYRGVFGASRVLQVASVTPAFKPATIGQAMLLMLQFDEGCSGLALVVWAVTMYLQQDTASKSLGRWAGLIGSALAAWVFAGYAGIGVLAIWARDEIVMSNEADDEAKKVK